MTARYRSVLGRRRYLLSFYFYFFSSRYFNPSDSVEALPGGSSQAKIIIVVTLRRPYDLTRWRQCRTTSLHRSDHWRVKEMCDLYSRPTYTYSVCLFICLFFFPRVIYFTYTIFTYLYTHTIHCYTLDSGYCARVLWHRCECGQNKLLFWLQIISNYYIYSTFIGFT